MKKIGIALAGLGNVGGAFVRQLVLPDNQRPLQKLGVQIEITGVATGRRGIAIRPSGIDPQKLIEIGKEGDITQFNSGRTISEVSDFIKKVPADVILWLTPPTKDGQPDTDLMIQALKSGKDIVSANKAPLAWHYPEIIKVAEEEKRKIEYGPTVLAINPPSFSAFDSISDVTKVIFSVNATSTLILTVMSQGYEFEKALEKAREINPAVMEADPSYDYKGFDTRNKAAVTANHFFFRKYGSNLTPKEIKTVGIEKVKVSDLQKAKAKGNFILLLGEIWIDKKGNGHAKVGPRQVSGEMATWQETAMGGQFFTESSNLTVHMPNTTIEHTGQRLLNDLIHILKGA